jgi:hypothetical protein
MESTIGCVVDAGGRLSVTNDAESAAAGRTYRFNLTARRLLTERFDPAGDRAARACLDPYVGTPEKLMKWAEEGYLPNAVLVNLLTAEKRKTYLEACAVIEKKYTDVCAAKQDPCLESGCAVEGEICLEPLLRAELDYRKACAGEWIKLFKTPGNRIEPWRN